MQGPSAPYRRCCLNYSISWVGSHGTDHRPGLPHLGPSTGAARQPSSPN